ncbi:MAG: FkbM family methyltransferase [Pseudomonadales bacterium]
MKIIEDYYLCDASFFERTLVRYQRAKSYGAFFIRRPTFKVPRQILFDGEYVDLDVPFSEKGVKWAFLDVVIDDVYGLRRLENENINTVLDIGANVGFFCIAARNCFSNAVIHGYEPNRQLETQLSHQANISKSKVYFEAVGKENGFVNLEFGEDSVHTRTSSEQKGSIPQVAFRDAIERLGGKVDLLKIDCEGGEWEILDDVESWQNVDRLTMEYHLFAGDHSHETLLAALEKIKFKVIALRKSDDIGMVYAEREGLR